jgi:uncharacterized membrane protein
MSEEERQRKLEAAKQRATEAHLKANEFQTKALELQKQAAEQEETAFAAEKEVLSAGGQSAEAKDRALKAHLRANELQSGALEAQKQAAEQEEVAFMAENDVLAGGQSPDAKQSALKAHQQSLATQSRSLELQKQAIQQEQAAFAAESEVLAGAPSPEAKQRALKVHQEAVDAQEQAFQEQRAAIIDETSGYMTRDYLKIGAVVIGVAALASAVVLATKLQVLAILAWLHIISAMGWLGGGIMFAFVVGPELKNLSPASSGEFLVKVIPGVIRFFQTASRTTILFGILLLYKFSNGDFGILSFGTSFGAVLTVGVSLGFIAFLISEFVAVPAQMKAVRMIKEMLASGQHQPPADFPKTLKVGTDLSTLVVFLVILASVFMVASGFG